MPQGDLTSLWNSVSAGTLSGRFLSGADATVNLSDLVRGSCLGGRAEELRGRSVLIVTADQLSAALALMELDGVARRLVLWPADLPIEHLPFVIASVPVDAIVSDGTQLGTIHPAAGPYVTCSSKIAPMGCDRKGSDRSVADPTKWILLTSGTTDRPKMVMHTFSSLGGAIEAGGILGGPLVWSTFYDVRRYGGLQIFLRAMLTGGSLVLSSQRESTAEFLIRVGANGMSHISGTPSHWRRALMSPYASRIAPRYIRLSGEIADQAILDNLWSFYPQAQVAHAFASTEAGVAFDVRDGLEGFPASLVGERSADVELKVVDGTLRIRSSRNAERYIGQQAGILRGPDGFVDTGDMLELRGDRYYFVGRRDGTINVGGLKVNPEEVEGVINRHPHVRMSLVRPRKNPLMGALVVADVVLKADPSSAAEQVRRLENEILQMCREALPRHKVPAAIKFVSELAVAGTGKIVRCHA
jgi:acyl-CoA synthetase (AMP-forming)/AMP-acid ligase II